MKKQLDDTKSMLDDKLDAEMRELVKEEVAELGKTVSELEEKVEIFVNTKGSE